MADFIFEDFSKPVSMAEQVSGYLLQLTPKELIGLVAVAIAILYVFMIVVQHKKILSGVRGSFLKAEGIVSSTLHFVFFAGLWSLSKYLL